MWGEGCGLRVGCGLRMGFQTMGRRRPLSRFMFGVAFLIWMASTVLLSQNPSALLFAHDQFARYQQSSNEPLRYHSKVCLLHPLPLPPPLLPFLSCPLTLLLPVACGGTSQDGTDECGIGGSGGVGSKRDVTDGDDTDDRAYTSAEGQEDDGDHTPSPSQSSEHSIFVGVRFHVCKWPCYVGCVHECAAIINIPLGAHCMP